MANAKHYILTSLTLGLIAAASALLIGGSNLLTKEKIKQNEIDKVNSGIATIFGDSAKILSEADIVSDDYQYVEHVYEISVNDVESGYVFKTSGSNLYGKIALIIGFTLDNKFVSLSEVVNEQTYSGTLRDEYLIPLNEGNRKLDDVSCGATYGAKLVRDMVMEAEKASVEKVWKQ